MTTRSILGSAAFALTGIAALLAAVTVAFGAQPALASCLAGPPAGSPYVFTGIVEATSSDGRVAQVRTAGHTVEVRGTPLDSGSAATSVDRTYRVGGRYEFHPINTTAPFEDNACTATRLLAMTSRSAGSGTAGSRTWITLGLAAVGAAALTGFVVRRRLGLWRRPRPALPI